MKITASKVGLALGTAITGVGVWIVSHSGPAQQNACAQAAATSQAEYTTQYNVALQEAMVAMANAPPDWDFCTDPSFYTRSCESCPMSVRWGGGPPGCPNIAVCGNHAKPCVGDDGGMYIIKGQTVNGQFDRYPKPATSPQYPNTAARLKWDQCYIDRDPAMGCQNAVPLGGVQTYNFLTLAQVPPGPQKDAWCSLWECPFCATTPPTQTATTIPSPTPSPPPVGPNPYASWIEQLAAEGVTAGCQSNPKKFCPTDPLTREQAAVWLLKSKHGASYVPPPCTGVFVDVPCIPQTLAAPTFGPAPSKTNTPHFGPARTPTVTPHIGPRVP
jgi:hypothetical protein